MNHSLQPHRVRGLCPALVLSLAFSACRGPGEIPVDPLPFHVAILPIEVEVSAPEGTVAAQAGDDELRLDLDAQRMGKALVHELEGTTFTKVTVLSPLEGERAELGRVEQEAHLQRVANDLGADLIVRAKLVYDPTVDAHINEKFWLNFPLFAIGGPFCYFIDDRSYDAQARLQAEFYSLENLEGPLDENLMVLDLPIQAEFEGIDLDFLDRANRNVSSYGLSLLVPAGLLAREGGGVDGAVEEGALAGLCRDLALKVQAARRDFQQTDLAGFYMDERQAVVARNGDGLVDVSIPLALREDGQGLQEYTLESGGQVVHRGQLDARPGADGRTWIRVSDLALPEGAETLRLVAWDRGNAARRYTFRPTSPTSAGS